MTNRREFIQYSAAATLAASLPVRCWIFFWIMAGAMSMSAEPVHFPWVDWARRRMPPSNCFWATILTRVKSRACENGSPALHQLRENRHLT